MEHTNGYNSAVTLAPSKRYLNVKEAAEYLGVGRHTIYRMVADRLLPFIPYGRIKRFDREQLDATIKARTVEAKI